VSTVAAHPAPGRDPRQPARPAHEAHLVVRKRLGVAGPEGLQHAPELLGIAPEVGVVPAE
jgi:hypothetical protein